jgi:hypothetical protein
MQTAMIDRDLIAIHKAGCANGNGASRYCRAICNINGDSALLMIVPL